MYDNIYKYLEVVVVMCCKFISIPPQQSNNLQQKTISQKITMTLHCRDIISPGSLII